MKQKKPKIDVGPHGDQWAVKETGKEKPLATFERKKEAEEYGRKLAKEMETELIIRGKDGKIQDKDSYGNDPHPPKDKKH
ncbi:MULTISPECIES: DUF2188 domain-containing protein [Thermus]|uniref:DUF2188 domain-containing protein n=1 Tax=Thermus thalpophilus TaxID=2908147 RepID=UPI001FA96610|nr:DUF2188 domain-containing protein [Thermus thalpophilus]